jgi:DNA-binding transcriptional ArsR family regulator
MAPRGPLLGRPALDAVASPARQELLSALGDGPATVAQLAHRLGRSRQALYYHLALLERAQLIAVTPPGPGRHERTYRVAAGRLAVGARPGSSGDRVAAKRAVQAMLRLTARETGTAIDDPATHLHGPRRHLVALRGKARLTRRERQRVSALIDELESLFRSATGRRDGALYAVTVVLTPAREAGSVPLPCTREP